MCKTKENLLFEICLSPISIISTSRPVETNRDQFWILQYFIFLDIENIVESKTGRHLSLHGLDVEIMTIKHISKSSFKLVLHIIDQSEARKTYGSLFVSESPAKVCSHGRRAGSSRAAGKRAGTARDVPGPHQGHARATPGPRQGHAHPPTFGKVGKKIFIF